VHGSLERRTKLSRRYIIQAVPQFQLVFNLAVKFLSRGFMKKDKFVPVFNLIMKRMGDLGTGWR
jgi:hypothetical protein